MGENDVINKSKHPVTKNKLVKDLYNIGIKPGSTLIVHSSLSSLGWVCGGAVTVIQALMEVLTPEGTLVMPAHSGDYSDPSYWGNPPVPEEWWQTIREEMPAYQPEITPTRGVGVIPEVFRKFPGVLRSKHPCFSFSAWGKHAKRITEKHSLDYAMGEDSPLGRIYELKGQVLLLGVDHNRNTSIHLAEYRANYLKKKKNFGSPILIDGLRKWVNYYDIEYNTDDFLKLGRDFEQTGKLNKGKIGLAQAKVMYQNELVDFAVEWFTKYREKMYTVEPITENKQDQVKKILKQRWGSTKIISKGRIYNAEKLPGFMAVKNRSIVGLITYNIDGNEWEIISLDSFMPGYGVGSSLLNHVIEKARNFGCKRIFLITSNDNINAIKFYQKRGFSLVNIYRDAINEARKLKPEIPEKGYYGIPIKDEIELEFILE